MNCVLWSIGDVWLHGMGTSFGARDNVCKLLPMSPD